MKIPQCFSVFEFKEPWANFVKVCQDEGVIAASLCENQKLGSFLMVENADGIWCLRKGGAVLRFPSYTSLRRCYDFKCNVKIFPPEKNVVQMHNKK